MSHRNVPKVRKDSSAQVHPQKTSFAANPMLQALLLAAFASVLYAQTITFDYAADDGMVILGHSTVQKGFAGIPDLLTKDSFRGLDEAQGRTETRRTYRPLSFVSFAIEYQFFGKNPQISHFMNVALYSSAVTLLFFLLRRLLSRFIANSTTTTTSRLYELLPFAVTLLFAAHPIHTEVVANIKSRDEIFAFLFLTLTLLFALQYLETSALKSLLASVGCFALALLSKESAITFLPTIPLALYLVQAQNSPEKRDIRRLLSITAPIAIIGMVYLLIWFGITGRVEDKLYYDTLNNPFIHATFAERTATATVTLGLYYAKSLFPTTLSTGYTYNEIPLANWSQLEVIVAALILCALVGSGLVLLARKHVLAFCFLGWCCTMAIASNYFVYAGGLLGERFLFTPSMFAMLALVWFIFTGVQRFLPQRTGLAMLAVSLLAGLYSVKTFARNSDWQTTEALLQADVVNTPNSIHLHRMYGGLLLQNMKTAASQSDTKKLLHKAREQFRAGLRVDSTIAPSLYNGIGNTFVAERRYDSAIVYYQTALRLDSDNNLYRKNLANAYTAQGVMLYSQNTPQASEQALSAMQASVYLMPTDSAYSNLGAMFAAQNQTDSAIVYLEKALTLNPALQHARKNLELCYRKRGTAQ
jgi:cytochrome c-type biogenesis protein CcmH/NrfG